MGIVGIALLAPWTSSPTLAARTDVVTLVNGDRVTGEVKELTQGLLSYKTDSMSTVAVEWVDVVGLTSDLTFQVEDAKGDYYYGAFLDSGEDGVLRVGIGEFQIDLAMVDVVTIARIKHGFWQTLEGSLSLGFQATQSTSVAQLSFIGNVGRRTRKLMSSVDLRLSYSATPEQPATKNNSLGFSQSWFLGNRYAAGGSLEFQQNDELGIDFRTLVGANATRSLVKALWHRLSASAGLSLNREQVTDGEGTNESVEVMLNVYWSVFKYKTPKTNLDCQWYVYPSVTERGRIRSQLNLSLHRELIKDFFLDLTGVYSYDSEPPNADAANDDYTISFGLGWTF